MKCFSKRSKRGWWEGEVRTKKGPFFIIAFPDGITEVVERERLRPPSGHKASGMLV